MKWTFSLLQGVVTIFEDEADILNEICFSDEDHFHLDSYVNKRNPWYWNLHNP
jgi:hypothetical protein